MNTDTRTWKLASAAVLVVASAGAVALPLMQTPGQTEPGRMYNVTVDSAQLRLACPPGVSDPLEPTRILARPVTLGTDSEAESPLSGGGTSWNPGEVQAGEAFPSVLSVAGVADGDGTSLLSTGCEAPALQSALVGGSTKVGEDSIIMLVNPGSQPVQVGVSAYGGTGHLGDLPQPITVPANAAITWMPATWFPDEERLSLLLTANGEGIAAWMQSSGREGEVSRGLARLVARPLREENVFVGVSEASGIPVLRIVNPTEQDLPVRVAMTTPGGLEDLPGTGGLVVAPGAVFEVNLAGIGTDPITIVASADQAFSASLGYQIEGVADPVVKDKYVESRTLASPTTPAQQVELPDLAELKDAVSAMGFDKVEVSVTAANLSGRPVTLAGQTLPVGTSYTWVGTEAEALQGALSAQAEVYVGLRIAAQSGAGPVESLVDLGYGAIASADRQVTLVP